MNKIVRGAALASAAGSVAPAAVGAGALSFAAAARRDGERAADEKPDTALAGHVRTPW
ncbi:hypothetical protein [Sphingopyxis sp. PET50]|uniref:hypothetical protein n=1 Tax=Sphingopyxis sp. PET50 TaxID=2976533 RepID=UPI0021AFB747|nr:hypothetical protein [Sphingopyxis sp. PET50]